jgi:hypothetical protein
VTTSQGKSHPTGADRPTVSVVVPCLNEERNLPYVFGRMPSDIDEVIVVDGGSVDRTVERAYELWPSAKVVQQTRRGKGNALVCGFEACTGDIIVMIDADGSTDPAEIPDFVRTLRAGVDFAKGSRFLPGGGSHDITAIRKLGNDALSGTVNTLFKTRYSDLCYGYNAFWRWVVPYLDLPDVNAPQPASGEMLWGDGFEIETLINVRVAALGLRVGEVASVEAARIHGVSNLSAVRDGSRVLRTILAERRRARVYRRSGNPTQQLPKVIGPRPVGAGSGVWSSFADDVLPAPGPVGMPALVKPTEER